jgi:hypothetical protein
VAPHILFEFGRVAEIKRNVVKIAFVVWFGLSSMFQV